MITGRPATKPTKLRGEFYLEVRKRNQKSGIKIHRHTKEQLLIAIREYEKSKEVIVLGQLKSGKMEEIQFPELV